MGERGGGRGWIYIYLAARGKIWDVRAVGEGLKRSNKANYHETVREMRKQTSKQKHK